VLSAASTGGRRAARRRALQQLRHVARCPFPAERLRFQRRIRIEMVRFLLLPPGRPACSIDMPSTSSIGQSAASRPGCLGVVLPPQLRRGSDRMPIPIATPSDRGYGSKRWRIRCPAVRASATTSTSFATPTSIDATVEVTRPTSNRRRRQRRSLAQAARIRR